VLWIKRHKSFRSKELEGKGKVEKKMKNMTAGKEITFGFGIVLILVVLIGVVSFTGVSGMLKGV